MLQAEYQSVFEARDRGAFRDAVLRFTQQLGFDTFAAVTVIDHRIGDTEFLAVENAPASYEPFLHETKAGLKDPVMQHCKRNSVPIVWDQDTYVAHGLGEKWEHQARYGYRTGIALALHLPMGRHFVLGVDRDQPLPRDRGALTRMVADLQLFAVHAQESALRLFTPTPVTDAPELSARELDALRWTIDGKTAWEVGAIMGISERTVVFHIQNAMRKLECATKHQAALKAVRLGLIRPPQ
jgi:DNA-binding CsgD family transcriptional regulator